jgi:crotonobetainyl-CoA:carnitine CoA-transferase CaiB-like acyl-CoA transferase
LTRGGFRDEQTPTQDSYLSDVRVLEIGDEHGEYAGRVLAGLGADVVKVEPIGGEQTRHYGPFYGDVHDPDCSLYFWHYNAGKRGVVLDLETAAGRGEFRSLASAADVVIDGRPDGLAAHGLGYETLKSLNSSVIHLRITPFGEDGPWAGFVASDLVHLALGGMMMNSGYDPDAGMFYDTPPIAPQMWHAYHTAGELGAMSVIAALDYRLRSETGQYLSISVHQANAVSTESDIPRWVTCRLRTFRQTGRHAMPKLTIRSLAQTKDGRYILPYATYIKNFPSSWDVDIAVLRKYGMQEDLDDAVWEDADYRAAHQQHLADAMDRLVKRQRFDSGLWQEMLAAGATWSPVRRPEENLDDEHWRDRNTFVDIEHPELGKTFRDVGSRWYSAQSRWTRPRRAPLVGEHDDEVRTEWKTKAPKPPVVVCRRENGLDALTSQGKPFALAGVRVIDLSWMLASAGAGRFLAAMGAEVIKVEHISRLDGMRFSGITYPTGGRAERDAATGPIVPPLQKSVNQSGSFNEINTGKLGLSLNLKDDRARDILANLIRDSDVVLEGFSPGTMERMGFGYDRLNELNPNIIYVQQSGLGQHGIYGRAKAFGPTAQAFSGLTDMSGFPPPWPPAGIGLSYLDWFGAYNMATAVLAALYRRDTTGAGCHIDASQVEVGLYLSGTAILDYTANGRGWTRYGNRSPYKPAAPSGTYRAAGEDKWIAISNFTDDQWTATAGVLGNPEWAAEPRFATLQSRLDNQDALDDLINGQTATWDRYELMYALQAKGIPAGVTQDAQDRFENDPQLRALGWTVELNQTETGTWPARAHPVRFSETPTQIGGFKDRGAPNYGEDTDEVLSRVLGYSDEDIALLRKAGVV